MSDYDDAGARARFERAYVVTRHLLGYKNDGLIRGLQVRSAEALRLVSLLSKTARNERAVVLAAEWGQVVIALARRGFRRESRR
jgi:hypothetical protein